MTTRATVYERGNGFPEVGDFVPGDDGELYEVISATGYISTHGCGAASSIEAEVELADWRDIDSDDDGAVFPALAVIAE